MFRNVVSTRELLSDSFSGSEQQNTHDSSYDSQQYSQLPYSQSGFSQVSTQDMFTQQFPGGSQTVETNSNSQGRKPTLYEKWKNKVTPFKPTHDKKSVNIGSGTMGNHGRQPHQTLQSKVDISFQHQLQMNKIKAKERDERDFLQQVVHTVQDCSKEVKLTLDSVKEKLDHGGEKAEDNLQQTINSFLDDLCKHQDRILNAIQEKDSNSTRLHMLEKELALRDAKIQSLEKSLEEQKRETADQIIRALQKELKDPQDKVEEKLSEILDTARDTNGQQTQQMSEQKQQLDRQQKMYADLKKSQQTLAKDSEKRLINEVSNLWNDIKKDRTLLQDIGDQLKSALEQQLEVMEAHINKLLDRAVPVESEHPREQGLRKKDIGDLLKKHRDSVEKIIMTQFQKQSKHHDLQLSKAVRKIAENERNDDQCESFLSLPQFEDKMGQYQDGFMKQIESLHERHMKEIKSLKADMAPRNHDKQEMFSVPHEVQAKVSEQRHVWHPELNISEKFSHQGQNGMQSAILERKHPFSHSGFNIDGTSKISNMQNRELAMVSPLTANYKKLNSRTFFSKAAFSPVATVLPQMKELTEPAVSDLVEEDEQQTGEVETEAQTQAQRTAKTKSKRRKKSLYGTRKRKSTAALIKSKKSPEIEKRPRYERAAKRSELNVSNSEIISAVMPKLLNDVIASRAKNKRTGASTQQTISVPPQNGMSVYNFIDEKHPTVNRSGTFIGKGYSYNSQKKDCALINSSKAVVYPTENMSPCTIASESRDSTPSMSVGEIVMKRRIKCGTHTPDLIFNGGGFDILSSLDINDVCNEKAQRFWTYKESMKYCQPGSWRQTKAVQIQY